MNLIEKILDRKGFYRERTISSLIANEELQNNDVVKVAETGYFYDIKLQGSITLKNGLKAEIKETTFLKLVTDHIKLLASQTTDGHMSKADKTKLDNVAINANNYVHPTDPGNKHLPTGGTAGQVLVNNGNGTGGWGNTVPTLVVSNTFTLNGYIVGVEP